jgi:Skp family chaperone for outer membrane proteins
MKPVTRISLYALLTVLTWVLGVLYASHSGAALATTSPALAIGYVQTDQVFAQSPAVQSASRALQDHVQSLQAGEAHLHGDKLQKQVQRNRDDLAKMQRDILGPVLTRLRQTEDQVRGQEHLSIILELSGGAQVSGGKDVTAEVLRRM